MAKWFYKSNDEQFGPVDPTELRRLASTGQLSPTDHVRREDMTDWRQASAVKGLFVDGSSAAYSATATMPPSSREDRAPFASNGAGAAANPAAPNRASYDFREHVSSVWKDLRSLNFWEEIVPVDASNIRRMITDPVILAVFVAGIGPLLFSTLAKPEYQRYAFSVLFAFLWGIVFKSYIIRTTAPTWILTAASAFTATIGMWLPRELSRFYGAFAASSNVAISLLGDLFGVGVCEEFCKILPVIAYLLWKRRRADPKVCILIGVFSGLGFAAFENRHYAEIMIEGTVGLTKSFGESGLRQGVQGAMANVLVRSLSLVFCHALWTGIFGYFLTVASLTGRRYIALGLTGLGVAATLHGVYDWSIGIQETLPAVIIAGTFILFYAYLTKLEALTQPGTQAD